MLSKLLSKIWPYLLVGLVLFLLGSWAWNSAVNHGRAEVQAMWDKQKLKDLDAAIKLKAEYDAREAQHQATNRRLSNELSQAEKDHALALSEQRAVYDKRLRDSATRSAIYKHQAEAGASGCRDLASHAAELDRSLVEGKAVAGELRSLVELRDTQLLKLGEQILNDRALLKD